MVRFGHVRGFDHTETTNYFGLKRSLMGWLPWERLQGQVHFDDQAAWDGLQAADQYAGMLNVAIRSDPFGGYDEHHLMRVRHQVDRSPRGQSWGWGFKVLGNEATFRSLPWWPTEGL